MVRRHGGNIFVSFKEQKPEALEFLEGAQNKNGFSTPEVLNINILIANVHTDAVEAKKIFLFGAASCSSSAQQDLLRACVSMEAPRRV